jgi:hypothetical protein
MAIPLRTQALPRSGPQLCYAVNATAPVAVTLAMNGPAARARRRLLGSARTNAAAWSAPGRLPEDRANTLSLAASMALRSIVLRRMRVSFVNTMRSV